MELIASPKTKPKTTQSCISKPISFSDRISRVSCCFGSSEVVRKDMDEDGDVVVVAVDASKEVTDYAMEWAVRNVLKPMDSLFLLAVLPSRTHKQRSHNFISGLKKKWGIGHKESRDSDKTSTSLVEQDLLRRINNVCERMMQHQLSSSDNLVQVLAEVNVVTNAQLGVVSAKASLLEAKWVILDRRLRKEGDLCLKRLDCNVVIIDRHIPKVLRAVDDHSKTRETSPGAQEISYVTVPGMLVMNNSYNLDRDYVTPMSSFGLESPRVNVDDGDSLSVSTTDKDQSHKDSPVITKLLTSDSLLLHRSKPSILSTRSHLLRRASSFDVNEQHRNVESYAKVMGIQKDINEGYWQNPKIPRPALARRSSLPAKHASKPPPLCSICNQNSPTSMKSPRKFSYKEICRATDGFSARNLLPEDGEGHAYKGVLEDGQVVAVKSARGTSELCSEVEFLSCARHRNLVMLVGYCVETERLLVYEFVCNGSLDKHLHGRERMVVMAWEKRVRVARGAARGLSYLHEDCRAGCVVHGDFRAKNILLTHDFEAMVGDLGLAKPGIVTEKDDVYAFGVILLELLTGLRASDLSRNAGHEFVMGRGSPLVGRNRIDEIMDSRLMGIYAKKEAECMIYVARLCTSPHPERRPRMSRVLKILEGDLAIDIEQPTSLDRTRRSVEEVTPFDRRRVVRSDCDFHDATEDFVSQEFEVYLQGSLAKFIKGQE